MSTDRETTPNEQLLLRRPLGTPKRDFGYALLIYPVDLYELPVVTVKEPECCGKTKTATQWGKKHIESIAFREVTRGAKELEYFGSHG